MIHSKKYSILVCWLIILMMSVNVLAMPNTGASESLVRGVEVPKSGLMGEFFKGGDRNNIEYYTFENKTGEQVIPVLDGNQMGEIFRKFNGTSDYATARFTGMLSVEQPGEYTFYSIGDDGFRIWVDGQLVIDFWKMEYEVPQTSKPISLTKGMHDIKVEYLQGWGGSRLHLEWSSSERPRQTIPAEVLFHSEERQDTGLTAQYYTYDPSGDIADIRFEGEETIGKISALDGTDLKPVLEEAVGQSEYAAAMIHGFVIPEEDGSYIFEMSGDDAYRMWIDDDPVIDSWQANSTGTKMSGPITLVGGKVYKVVIHYAQANDDANLSLAWKKIGEEIATVIPQDCLRQAKELIPGNVDIERGLLAEVYEGIYLQKKIGERIVPNAIKTYDWAGLIREFNNGSSYDASIRMTGLLEIKESAEYKFYVVGDDGFRLWVDGELVIDFWKFEWDKPQESKLVELEPGFHDIKLEFLQNTGGTYIDLKWSKNNDEEKQAIPGALLYPSDSSRGIIGEYYACSDNNDPEFYTFTNKKEEIMSEQINFDNDTLSNILNQANNTTNHAVVRWTGKIKPEVSEEYIFTMIGNDGYRVYLNDKLMIDNWSFSESAVEKSSQPIKLDARRQYEIRVELLQKTGDAEAKLYWKNNAMKEKEIIPTSAFYAPNKVEYERMIARNTLGEVLRTAEELNNNATVGTLVGQTTQEAKNEFEAVIQEVRKFWVEFESNVGEYEKESQKLEEASKKFKSKIIISGEGAELTEFNTALYQGQDPFISYKDGYYYLVSSSADAFHNKMYVSKSKTLLDQGEKVCIFDFKGVQSRIFAPEIFFIDGKWYIYYCADVGVGGYDWRHQACVLESKTDDPQGEWIDRGVLYTGANGINSQANDFTVFEYEGELYACWGTMEKGLHSPAIAKMDSPTKISEDRFVLPPNGGEGPRVIQKDGKLFITVSMGNFKGKDYRLGMYVYDENGTGDLLDIANWSFVDNVFHGNEDVYGPARAGFVKSADGTEDWMVYHSKVYPANNNGWRQVGIKKIDWNEDGTPNFGDAPSPYEFMPIPSGDPGIGKAYQAEAADVLGATEVDYKSEGYQGSGFVKIPEKDGSSVKFTIDVPKAGDYLVRIRYANGVKAQQIIDGKIFDEWGAEVPDMIPVRGTLGIYVNNERVKTAIFDKTETDWKHWMYACERVTLEEGTNTIMYQKDTNDSGNIYVDYIAVQEAHEPSVLVNEKTFEDLKALIEQAEAKVESDYPVENWKEFALMLESAKRMTSQSSVLAIQARWNALNSAMELLSGEVNKPQVTMDVPLVMTAGKVYEMVVGIDGIDENMYAQDLTVRYDSEVFEVLSVKGIDKTVVADSVTTDGAIRVLLATEEGLKSGEKSITVELATKRVDNPTIGTVMISNGRLGIVTEGVSQIILVDQTQKNIIVEPAIEVVDKTDLNEIIEEAKEVSNNASIGEEPGQYPQSAKVALDQAISVAEQVSKNSNNQVEIDAAAITLRKAIEDFNNKQIKDKDADINTDGKINVADLALVAYYYTAKVGDINWNEAEKVDLNNDDKIDITDLVIVANKILEIK